MEFFLLKKNLDYENCTYIHRFDRQLSDSQII